MLKGKGPKKPKTCKGCHTSRNAYTLVYHRSEMTDDLNAEQTAECVSSEQSGLDTDQCSDHGHQEAELTAEDSFSLTDLPIRTQRYVQYDNQRFEEWVEEMKAIRVTAAVCILSTPLLKVNQSLNIFTYTSYL